MYLIVQASVAGVAGHVGHKWGGVSDGGVDQLVAVETSTVDTGVGSVDEDSGVSLSLRLGLTLDQMSVASGQGSVDTVVVGDNRGLDNSGDNGLGGDGGHVGHKWGGVGHGGVDQLVAVETSTVDTGVGSVDEESGVSLSLRLGLTLDQMSVASGQGSVDTVVVGDNRGLDNSGDNGLGG